MEARETDKLFRDKLKNMASQPKVESWDKLESLLDENNKKPLLISLVWKVAAAILLLIVSGWVFFNVMDEENEFSEIAEVVNQSDTVPDDHVIVPQPLEKIEANTEIKEEKADIPKKEVAHPIKIKSQQSVEKFKEEGEKLIEAKEPVKVEMQQLAQVDIDEIEKEEKEEKPEKKKIKTIKITYKRGNSLAEPDEMLAQEKVDTTGTKKIKELWEQTREIKPGDIWADIRDAKDNLFQRNSKKNNVKNLNK